MSDIVGRMAIEVEPDTTGFGSSLRRQLNGIGKNMQKVGVGLTAGLTVPLLAFGKQSVDVAADVNESQSKVNAVFGKSAKVIRGWAAGGARDFGLAKGAALDAAGGFGNMFDQLGFGSRAASKMSRTVVELGADFASFHNLNIEDVLEAQSAAFRGEYDAAQKVLPLLSAANVEQKALAQTGKANADALTAQEKAAATYALMLEGAGKAQGDFDRTASGLANTQRILAAQWENIQGTLGKVLLPIVTDIAGRVSVWADRLAGLNQEQATFAVKVAAAAAAAGPLLVAVGTVVRSLSAIKIGLAGFSLGPIGLLIGVIAGLAAAFFAAYQRSQPLQDAVARLLQAFRPLVAAIRPLIPVLGNLVVGALSSFATVAARVVNAIVPVVQQITLFTRTVSAGHQPVSEWGQTVMRVFQTVRDIVGGVIRTLAGWFGSGGTVARFLRENRGFFQETWKQIVGLIRAAANLIAAIVSKLLAEVSRFWRRHGDTIMRIVRVAWDTIKEVIRAALNILRGIIDTVTAAIRGDWRGVWTGIKKIVDGVWDGIFGIVRGGIRSVKAVIDDVMRSIKGTWDTIWFRLKSSARSAINGVISVINGLIIAWNKIMRRFGFNSLIIGTLGHVGISGSSSGARRPGVQAATGGAIDRGPAGKDRVQAWLTRGEHVWTEREVRAAGGHRAIFALRKAVLQARGLRPEALLQVIQRGFVKPTGGDPMFRAGGIIAGKTYARSRHGDPYVWGGVGPGGADCSGHMSAILSKIKGTSIRRWFTTGTITAGIAGLKAGLGPRQGFSIGAYRGNPGHMAGTIDGVNVEAGGSPSFVKYNRGVASGADHPRFNLKFHMPGVGIDWKTGIARWVTPILNRLIGTADVRLPGIFGAVGSALIRKARDEVFTPSMLERRTEDVSSLHTGTSFVPRDMLAFLQRGEAVVPAALNRMAARNRAGAMPGGGVYQINWIVDGRVLERLWLDTGRKVVTGQGGLSRTFGRQQFR